MNRHDFVGSSHLIPATRQRTFIHDASYVRTTSGFQLTNASVGSTEEESSLRLGMYSCEFCMPYKYVCVIVRLIGFSINQEKNTIATFPRAITTASKAFSIDIHVEVVIRGDFYFNIVCIGSNPHQE